MPSRRRKIPPPSSTPRTPSLPTSPPAEALSPLSPISPWPPLPPLERPVPSNTTCTSSPDDLPTSREIYGSLTVLLTYLAFATYLAWSILPGEWLERIGWSWYPAQSVSSQ
jgi:phosphatidylinositol glycan class P protein